jgi:hypothetical protein
MPYNEIAHQNGSRSDAMLARPASAPGELARLHHAIQTRIACAAAAAGSDMRIRERKAEAEIMQYRIDCKRGLR